jgi:hypothetical protein
MCFGLDLSFKIFVSLFFKEVAGMLVLSRKVVRGELDRERTPVVERELQPSENQVFHLRLKIDNEMVALQKDVG